MGHTAHLNSIANPCSYCTVKSLFQTNTFNFIHKNFHKYNTSNSTFKQSSHFYVVIMKFYDFCAILHIFSFFLLHIFFISFTNIFFKFYFLYIISIIHHVLMYLFYIIVWHNVPVLSRWDWRTGPPPPAVGCWPGAGGRPRCPPAWSGGGSVGPPNQCYGTLEPSPH